MSAPDSPSAQTSAARHGTVPTTAPFTPAWTQPWWPLIGALVYASVLATWPNEGLHDRDNYLAYLDNAPIFLLGWLDGDLLQILANEPIWILLNFALQSFLPNEQALQVLIFVPAALIAHRVLRVSPPHAIVLLLFLLAPQVLKNHVIHLRQGLAISIFLLAWMTNSNTRRWTLLLATPLIHSSFFFVLLLVAMAILVRRLKLTPATVVLLYALLGIAVALSLGELVRAAGARQADEVEFVAAEGASGLGFAYWCVMLVLLISQARSFWNLHTLEIGSVVFYLATYFLSPFTARVFESTLLLVLLASLKMKGTPQVLFIGLALLFPLFQWLLLLFGTGSIFMVASN